MLLGVGGHHENVLKICPPLTIDEPTCSTRRVELTIDAIKGAR